MHVISVTILLLHKQKLFLLVITVWASWNSRRWHNLLVEAQCRISSSGRAVHVYSQYAKLPAFKVLAVSQL